MIHRGTIAMIHRGKPLRTVARAKISFVIAMIHRRVAVHVNGMVSFVIAMIHRGTPVGRVAVHVNAKIRFVIAMIHKDTPIGRVAFRGSRKHPSVYSAWSALAPLDAYRSGSSPPLSFPPLSSLAGGPAGAYCSPAASRPHRVAERERALAPLDQQQRLHLEFSTGQRTPVPGPTEKGMGSKVRTYTGYTVSIGILLEKARELTHAACALYVPKLTRRSILRRCVIVIVLLGCVTVGILLVEPSGMRSIAFLMMMMMMMMMIC